MNGLADRKQLLTELEDKEYAHAYMDEFLNASIATQIKVLREQRGWTQEELANLAEMKQERISVLENVNYSSWSLSTLKKLAKAFDLTLRVSFENFSSRLEDIDSLSRTTLQRIPRSADIAMQKSWLETAGTTIDWGELHVPTITSRDIASVIVSTDLTTEVNVSSGSSWTTNMDLASNVLAYAEPTGAYTFDTFANDNQGRLEGLIYAAPNPHGALVKLVA